MKSPNSEKGFAYIGLVAALVFVTVGAGLTYTAIKLSQKQTDPDPPAVTITEPTTEEERPHTDFQPYKDAYDISGEWRGDYIVMEPDECAGVKGGWIAHLKQSGDTIGGTYTSDKVSGMLSGGAIKVENVSWSVSGGEGDISFNGQVISQNVVEGGFTGPICHEEFAPTRTTGTFFGGRLTN